MTRRTPLLSAHPADALVSFTSPASLEADQYRGMRHIVERISRDSALQIFALTSPGSGDGKTVTTLNLAGSLAQSPEARVLVIDADLHRPSVAQYLGIEQRQLPGLIDLIARDDVGLEDAVGRIAGLNLSILQTGQYQGGAYELLNSPKLDAIIQEARRHFDYVLVDTPPLMPLPDCRLIGRCVDGFFLVVAAHRTPRKAVAETLNLIDRTKLMGTVFNGDDQPLGRYSAYYAYCQPAGEAARPAVRGRWWQKLFGTHSPGGLDMWTSQQRMPLGGTTLSAEKRNVP
jgi:capsular exopolysaccharide synthesis family protein